MNRTPRCTHACAPGFCPVAGCPHQETPRKNDASVPRVAARKCHRCHRRRSDLELDGAQLLCRDCRDHLAAYRADRGMGGYARRTNRSVRRVG